MVSIEPAANRPRWSTLPSLMRLFGLSGSGSWISVTSPDLKSRKWKPRANDTTLRANIEAERTTPLRGSLINVPQGAGEIYVLKAQDGTVIWQDQIEQGDWVWVLPGIYTCDLDELVGDPILISFTVQTLPGSATQLEIFTAP